MSSVLPPGPITNADLYSSTPIGNYIQQQVRTAVKDTITPIVKDALKEILPVTEYVISAGQCVSDLPTCRLNVGWEVIGKGIPGLIWYVGKKISYLPDALVNGTGQLLNISIESNIQKRISDAAWFFHDKTNLGKNTQNPLNISHLITASLLFKYFSNKSIQNATSVCRNISVLAKSIFTRKLIYEINLPSLPGSKEGDGLHASVRLLRKYTIGELISSIGMETIFATIWGSLAYGTHCLIYHAISEASKNDPNAQKIVSILSIAWAVYPVFSTLKQKIIHAIPQKPLENHQVSAISAQAKPSIPEQLQPPSDEELAIIIRKINEAEEQRQMLEAQKPENEKFVLDIGQGTEKELQDLVEASRELDIEQGIGSVI